MKKKGLSLLMGALLLVSTFVPGFAQGMSANQADVASTTYDYKWWALATVRNKVDTSYVSTSTSFTQYATMDSFTNSKTYAVEHKFSDSATKSSSVSLGAKVPIKAIELEFGGEVSYSNTRAYETTISVPGKDTVALKMRTRTESMKYSSVVQRQDLYTDLVWRNVGSSSTSSSTQTVKSPDWIVQ